MVINDWYEYENRFEAVARACVRVTVSANPSNGIHLVDYGRSRKISAVVHNRGPSVGVSTYLETS